MGDIAVPVESSVEVIDVYAVGVAVQVYESLVEEVGVEVINGDGAVPTGHPEGLHQTDAGVVGLLRTFLFAAVQDELAVGGKQRQILHFGEGAAVPLARGGTNRQIVSGLPFDVETGRPKKLAVVEVVVEPHSRHHH